MRSIGKFAIALVVLALSASPAFCADIEGSAVASSGGYYIIASGTYHVPANATDVKVRVWATDVRGGIDDVQICQSGSGNWSGNLGVTVDLLPGDYRITASLTYKVNGVVQPIEFADCGTVTLVN
jgi:hypothetical protein